MDDMIDQASLDSLGIQFTPGDILKAAEGVIQHKLGDDAELFVEFYPKMVLKKNAAGDFEYQSVDYCKIMRPNSKSWWDQPVRLCDKQRFAHLWQDYKSGKKVSGISVDAMCQQGLITQAQADMLKQTSIHTIQQLAACSDITAQLFGNEGIKLRKLAQGYLSHIAKIKDEAKLDEAKKEMKNQADELRTEQQELKDKIAKLEALLEAKPSKATPKQKKHEAKKDDSQVEVLEID